LDAVEVRAANLSCRSQRLVLTASLKAANVGAALSLVQSSVTAVATRLLIQSSLQRYKDQANNTDANWFRAIQDLGTALNGAQRAGILMQAKIFATNDSLGSNTTLLQATGADLDGVVQLPSTYPDGTPVFLGDSTPLGYPAHLYPNLTYGAACYNGSSTSPRACFGGMIMDANSTLFLGPWTINGTYSLASLTLPVINNTSRDDILGWMTIIVDAVLITNPIRGQQEGLDQTGITLVVGPNNVTNRLPAGVLNVSSNPPDHVMSRFVLPPNNTLHRHDQTSGGNLSFDYSKFPAVKKAWTDPPESWNLAGSFLSTTNEEGITVSVGYATVPSDGLVDWLLLLEQSHEEVWEPITQLRKVILACVFGTLGAVLILIIPIVHYSTAPIRRLRDATKKSVLAPGYDGNEDSSERSNSADEGIARGVDSELARKEGFLAGISRWRHRNEKTESQKSDERKRQQFRIPARVKDREHVILDELTDLTATFNEMSDELMIQYETLEERVKQRTAELEESKIAAESANEAKTVFVANISHELKTPLNGILGIAQASQAESSLAVVKRDMKMIFNQGDLLNKLIQDLLLFSKNQVDHNIVLEEGEFRVRDITSQVFATFQLMAKEREVDFKILFEGPNTSAAFEETGVGDRKEYGPFGSGRVRDMVLWGDKTRIVQVVNNLTSNALKFTPSGGTVRVIVRCIGEPEVISRRGSVLSKQNSLSRQGGEGRTSRQMPVHPEAGSERSMTPTSMNQKQPMIATANEINAIDHPVQASHAPRTTSPPVSARDVVFEWEVVDTGPGMPEHVQEKVFEPFFQGDMALSKKFQGTGLGLSICAQLASLMSGSMGLRSEEGVGSTFTMRIPLKQIGSRLDSSASSQATGSVRFNSPRNSISGDSSRPAEGRYSLDAPGRGEDDSRGLGSFANLSEARPAGTPPPSTPSSSKQGSNDSNASPDHSRSLKILVAEDNKTNQVVVQRLLKMESITDVTIAVDGRVAYDMVIENMARSDNFDLIFMDVQVSIGSRQIKNSKRHI
jgi:osomolarity two-component system sensor histidine kinase SLN1